MVARILRWPPFKTQSQTSVLSPSRKSTQIYECIHDTKLHVLIYFLSGFLLLSHSDIVDKCDEATSHLNTAQGSWSGLASSFGASPWNAARSSHGLIVRARLSLCGDALGAIYQQPEMKTCSSYKQPVNNCKVRATERLIAPSLLTHMSASSEPIQGLSEGM